MQYKEEVDLQTWQSVIVIMSSLFIAFIVGCLSAVLSNRIDLAERFVAFSFVMLVLNLIGLVMHFKTSSKLKKRLE